MLDSISNNKTAVALGNFDGFHIGHRAVVMNAVREKSRGLLPVVLLFDVHPLGVIRGEAPPQLITPTELDNELTSIGAKPVTVSFREIMNMSPGQFVDDILVSRLNAGSVSCGFNFHFGKNSSGTPEILKKLCDERGIALTVAPAVIYDGKPVSSTRIRRAVSDGDMRSARAMLSHPFYYTFKVESGDRIGRTLGFPTINQFFPDGFAVPKFGVYASRVMLDGAYYPAVTDIGVRPTLVHKKPRSETNIIGFSGDLYGLDIKIELLDFIRPEIKFASLDELKEQISRDSETGVRIYNELSGDL